MTVEFALLNENVGFLKVEYLELLDCGIKTD